MSDSSPAAYRVLARKYRPTRLSDLLGQEALVRTLANAIETGRIAHAFVLTGVRGVGKTTTARIIARALNCVGANGKGGPTPDPCGVCEHCTAIAEDRHMDVIEMDAASNTGVANIRELIDGVRYRPVSARFKIYIVDEVHMLSNSAFNALLKTLEEPPEHVKFIFATTEIRKVPITVLSRCQRFDLRRFDQATLATLLADVAVKEGRKIAPGAAQVLARAADGSARDGLSLLDRALAHVDGDVSEDATRELLGLADRTQVFDLFEATMGGRPADALAQLQAMYRVGADPSVVVQDMLEIVHHLTRLQAAPVLADEAALPQAERERGKALAAKLAIPALARAWTMLLKGLAEVQTAPQPLAALEMVLIRLAYAADLPSPADLVATLRDGGGGQSTPRGGGGGGGGNTGARASLVVNAVAPVAAAVPAVAAVAVPAAQAELAQPRSFRDVVDLFAAKREGILHGLLWNTVHCVRFEAGLIEIRAPGCPRDFASRLMDLLGRWTGRRWVVTLSDKADGEPTLAQQAAAMVAARKARAAEHPLVRAALELFPGATLEVVRGADEPPAAAGEPAEAGEDAPPDYDLIPDSIDPESDEP
ncbi:MAG: DNA polymerase III subunit gamma/tau [Alphaproteobacteria bacterium]|nr:DNA polymerase III subunit gamma/tau [Alphaproteobacteria bacterium]